MQTGSSAAHSIGSKLSPRPQPRWRAQESCAEGEPQWSASPYPCAGRARGCWWATEAPPRSRETERRKARGSMERSGLALCSWLDAAQPLHTRMTGVVPLRTVDAARPPRIRFERRSLAPSAATLRRSPYPHAGCVVGIRRREPELQHRSVVAEYAREPIRCVCPPPQASQLEQEPLVGRMARTIRPRPKRGISSVDRCV